MNLLFAGNYDLDDSKINELECMGIDVFILKDEKNRIPVEPSMVDAVVCNWLFVNHNINQFKKLKYVQLLSAGLDRMPMQYAKDNNITVNNARGVYSIPMAEYALSGVLQLVKKTAQFKKNQENKQWIKIRNIGELSNMKVCILGIGSVGCEVAKKFSVFCQEIVGVDIVNNDCKYIDKFYHIDEIDKAMSHADIIAVTLPLTNETKHILDKDAFNKMKKHPIIINIARGSIINEEDLIAALKDGTISGAVLDVFENEPLDALNELWELDNVIVTPHNSFESTFNNQRMWQVIINNMRKFLSNE